MNSRTSIETVRDNDGSSDHYVIPLVGRFDAHMAPAFRAVFTDAISNGARRVTVDLRNVVFIDSTALAEFVRSDRQAEEAGARFELCELSDPVRVILELTGLASFFTCRPAS